MDQSALSSLPPLHIKGRVRFTIGVNKKGEQEITMMQSPMMTKEEACTYVGLGINAFDERVNNGTIHKRGETKNVPYHIDDLDEYLELNKR